MTILINVINQELRLATPFKTLVNGTQEFIKFKFVLDDAWLKITTFAQFTQDDTAYNVYLDDNKCVFLPREINSGAFTLMLYGTGGHVIGTSNYLTLKMIDNIFVGDAQSTEITESLYTQLINIVNSYGDRIDAKVNHSEYNQLINRVNTLDNTIKDKIGTEELESFEEEVDTKIENVKQLIGTPLVAQSSSKMTDKTKIYVYTGNETGYQNGYWYYYDGTAWTQGGVYNSVAINVDDTLSISGVPADSKKTGDKINELKSGINDLYNTAYVTESASGSVAHFVNGADNVPMKSVVIDTESASATVTRTGKNLLQYPYRSVDSTYQNVTRVTNSDGSVTFNGTANANSYFNFVTELDEITLKAGTYVLSANEVPQNALISVNVRVNGENKYNVNLTDTSNPVTFTPQEDGYLRCYVTIRSGAVINNWTVYPMLRRASDADGTYEPYAGETYEVTLVDGVVQEEIKSLLGINNIWSDAGDVEVEYRADTKLYIDKSGINELHDFTLALKNSPYSYYPYGTPTAGRRIDAETGEAFDGTTNYYAFEKFIEIPKGRIYFECESGASGNIVFYDADKNVVDAMGINSKFVQLIGNHYDNTLATYMRIGIYKSGGIGNTDFNFAYSYDGTGGKPLFRNVNTDQISYKNNRLTSDFIYADEPMLVTSKDTSKLVFGVLLYDSQKTLLKTYYLADAKTINYVSVPKGHYFTVYCDAPNTVQIAPTTELLDVISIEKTDIGVFTFTYNTDFLQLSKVFVGTIENQYSESALLMHCDNYGSSGLYTYRVAFYPSADSDKPYLTTDAMFENFFIPAKTYFRIILKRRSGTTVVDDFKAISLKEIPYNTPETQGIASLIGKTRQQMDSDVLASYYDTYLANKISAISGLADSCQAQFIFLTDYHFGTYNNTHNARALLTRIVMGTPVNVMFNGGDTWTRGTGESSYGEAKTRLISGVDETTPNAPCNWFFALGNHETGLDGKLTTPMFSTKDMQRIMGGNVTGYDVMYDPASTNLAYWVDIDDIRYICTNVGLGTVGSDEAQANVKLFMAEALSTLNGKTAVVVGHVYYTGTSDSVNGQAAEIGEMIVAFNAKGEYNIGSYGNVNFANASGEVALWITGHRHKDVTAQLSDGTPVVITTTCNAGAELGGLDRTVGTVNENAFDVVSIDTTNKTVYLTRIGAGQDRTLSYGGQS